MADINSFTFRNLSGTALDHFISYGEGKGDFKEYFDRKLKMKVFWTMLTSKVEELSEFALKLSVIPAGTSQLERIFFNWSTIHTKLRNKLKAEKSKKLIHIYYSYISTIPEAHKREIEENEEYHDNVANRVDEIVDVLESDSEEENFGFDLEDIDVQEDSDFDELFELAQKYTP